MFFYINFINSGMSHVILCFVFMSLLSMLRGYRAQKAFIHHLPKHCIFKDATIMEIVSKKPFNIEDLLKIKGIGVEKAKQFGEDIIGMVKGFQLTKNKPVVVKHDTRNSRCRSASCSSRRSMKSIKSPTPPPVKRATTKKSDPMHILVPSPPSRSATAKKSDPMDIVVSPPPTATPPKVVMKHQSNPLYPPGGKGPDKFDVYVLELQGGKVYVGKSSNTDKRITQHSVGSGSAFTKAFPPTGVILPRLGNISGDGDAAERDETLRYMYQRGIDNVRGWRYTLLNMSKEDKKDAERNIREVLDLCRKCGYPGHFIKHCTLQYDRHGQKI